MAEDAVLQALAALEQVIAENDRRATLIKKRMARIRRARAGGLQYSETVANEDGPLIVQLLTESSRALDISGANARRAEAEALYAGSLRAFAGIQDSSPQERSAVETNLARLRGSR